MFVLFFFSREILLIKSAGVELGAASAAVGAHRLEGAYKLGALQAYDTNFLYVVRPPADGLPLLNLDNGWYAYFGALVLCGFVGITAVHLPFVIKEMIIKNK